MNLAQLYYFCKLAEVQHYTKSAQELHITQPTLSGSIKSLEQELGVVLFEKQGRNVALTNIGKDFYHYVYDALHILDEGVAQAKEASDIMNFRINIGCIPTIQLDFLPQVLFAFQNQNADAVTFKIFEAQTNEIIRAIQEGEWDVGFCSYIPIPNLYFVPMFTQPLVAAVHRDHPLAKRESILFSDLFGQKLISYHLEQPIGRDVQKLLAEHHLEADHRYGYEELICGMCQLCNDYVGILLKTPQLRFLDDIVFIPLSEVPPEFHFVYMVYNQKKYKFPAVVSFIEYVTAFCSYHSPKVESKAVADSKKLRNSHGR